MGFPRSKSLLTPLGAVNPSPLALKAPLRKILLSRAWAAPTFQGRCSKHDQEGNRISFGTDYQLRTQGSIPFQWNGKGPKNQTPISQCGTPFWQSHQVSANPAHQPLQCRQPRTSHRPAAHLTQASGKTEYPSLSFPLSSPHSFSSTCSLLLSFLYLAFPFSPSSLPPSPPPPVQMMPHWLDFIADADLSTEDSFAGLQGVGLPYGLCSSTPLQCQDPFLKRHPAAASPGPLKSHCSLEDLEVSGHSLPAYCCVCQSHVQLRMSLLQLAFLPLRLVLTCQLIVIKEQFWKSCPKIVMY